MRRSIRSLAAGSALVLGSVSLATLGAEGVLRAFPQLLPPVARLRLHWNQQGSGGGSRADPYIGFLGPVRYEGEGGAGEARFHFTTDQQGFRNPLPWPDTAEIVVVGDSEVFGFGVADDSTWTSALTRDLARSRIVNLGLSGMAPEQYMRVYERFGAALDPKVLLFGLFPGNDLDDQRQFTAWLRAGSPATFAEWRSLRGARPGPARRLLLRSYLYWLVVYASQNLGTPIEEPQVFDDGSRIRFTPSMLQGQAAMAVPGNGTFDRILEIIRQTREEAIGNGTEFLVLLFPTKEEVYLPLRGEQPPQVLAPFASALGEESIPYLDLTIPLQAEARAGERLFFEVDGHPNVAGYGVIARAVLSHLRENADRYGLTDWQ